MGNCSSCGGVGGPYSVGRELVEFVCNAHGGAVRDQLIPNGGLATQCQGCGAAFTLITFVGQCPDCGGVHAVAPPNSHDAACIQFAGVNFQIIWSDIF